MFTSLKQLGIAAILVTLAGTTVQAQVNNTGTGVLATDPFWSVTYNLFGAQPGGGNVYGPTSGAQANATVITSPQSFWQPNNALYRWIGISANGNAPTTSGVPVDDGVMRFDYVFSTTVLGTSSITGFLGWDEHLLGYNFGAILGTAAIASLSGMSLFTPAANFDQGGFCHDGDGEFPTSNQPNCVRSFNIGSSTPGQRLNLYVRGDGQADGLLLLDHIAEEASVAPEPSTYALLATGLIGLGIVGLARRRRRAV